MRNFLFKLFVFSIIAILPANSAFAKEFPDLNSSYWANNEIQSLAKSNVVVGYPDGTFRPDAPATRAEFATMVIKSLGQEHATIAATVDFSDVPGDHWANEMIQKAIAFDLIKGFPDGTFRPEASISKAEAVALVVSTLKTRDISCSKAKDILSMYLDANNIPDWAVIPAAKSEILGMTAHPVGSNANFHPNEPITRGEIAFSIYNMIKEAKLNPNDKLADAMKPKTATGFVINGVTVNGSIATIPAGTVIPVAMITNLDTQTNQIGQVFFVKANTNLVTKDNYLLVEQGGCINGEIAKIKPGKLFVRNGKLVLDTNFILTMRKQQAGLFGNIDTKQHKNWFMRFVRFVFKGEKIKLYEGDMVNLKLTKPVSIDLSNGWIIENKL